MSTSVETNTAPTGAARLAGLDKLRGLAVVLMVLDHALVALDVGGVGSLMRLTLTRASLPLFGLVAGSLLVDSRRRRGRLAAVVGCGLVATWLGAPLGIGQPDVLVLLALALLLAGWALRQGTAVWWLCGAVIQGTTWTLTWSGYQPGVVLALVLVGALLGRAAVGSKGDGLPAWLGDVGRYPLSVYVGHLAFLAVIV